MTTGASLSRLGTTATGATVMVAAAAVCFGLVPVFARALQGLEVADAAIAFYRYAFSALVVLPFLPRARAKRREGLTLFAAGLCMGLGWLGYLYSIEHASVAAAGIVYMSYPIFAVIFAWALVGLRPTGRAWTACLMVLAAATVLMMGDGVGEVSVGLVLVALPAPIFFGLIIVVLSAMVRDLAPLERMACGMTGALAGLGPLALTTAPAALAPGSPAAWLAILGLGATTALIPQLLYTLAAPRIGPARTAAAGAFELPTMILIGWLVLAEALGAREIAAAALVLAAILVAPPVEAPAARPASAPG